MQHFIKTLFFSAALLASITSAFELKSSKYFVEPLEALDFTCGDLEWNDETRIVFYKDNYKTLIFDSFNQTASTNQPHTNSSDTDLVHALAHLLEHVATKDNKTLVLRNRDFKGLVNLGCTINGVKSAKTITIPYIQRPFLDHSKVHYPFNVKKNIEFDNVTISCHGKVDPEDSQYFTVFHDGISVATVHGKELRSLGTENRLTIQPGVNNTIVFVSDKGDNHGSYSCMMSFHAGDGTLVSFKTKDWSTSGVAMLTSQLFLVAVSLISMFFYY